MGALDHVNLSGMGQSFDFRVLMFMIRFWFWVSLYDLKAKTKTEK